MTPFTSTEDGPAMQRSGAVRRRCGLAPAGDFFVNAWLSKTEWRL
jgi:hypothetical protein